MINSRDIEDLEPVTAGKARAFRYACHAVGIEILITCTLRDRECQVKLYAQGRTEPGKIITNAKPGWSFHNYGVAFDFVPIVHGKAIWDDDALWEKCGHIAKSLGLTWGGDFRHFPDKPHMQYDNGRSIEEFLANSIAKESRL
jgi:peptidoglycan L-alanyl-D-glutamate endopeptidase CwlK